jgi:hypothetical protein
MKPIRDLYFGFNDAENYKRPENKAIFDRFFLRTEEFQDIFKASTNFLIGEKGTGKTAYATYIVNNETFNTLGFLNFIRETDYQKFIKLKSDNHLQLSDYQNIWKVLIYLLLADRIKQKESEHASFGGSANFEALSSAINEYYINAFSPEIIHALNFVERTKHSAELISKYFKALGEHVKENGFTHSKFQTNLLYIQNHFEKALNSIKLKKNYILFIDGIDIRPNNVPYEEYLDCIKGLANAVWALNNDFFPTITSPGRIKVILLLRPDIFSNLGMQNQNNKLKDNSVLLDWRTNYADFETSKIYLMADRMFGAQQDSSYRPGRCWPNYFPYTVRSAGKIDAAFIQFLRYSFYRPRDIITLLDLLKEFHLRNSKNNATQFLPHEFTNSELLSRYSDYLMGEIKDYLSFYHSDNDYEIFRKFFDSLNGRTDFDYDYFNVAFNDFESYLDKNQIQRPRFFDSADTFLQFLFDLNVICYIEVTRQKRFIRWCFRERSYSNLSPKVKADCQYQIHYGLMKNLNLGATTIKRPRRRDPRR